MWDGWELEGCWVSRGGDGGSRDRSPHFISFGKVHVVVLSVKSKALRLPK